LISACEQISSSMSATSISVVGSHCKVLGISPGQMRHAEPSLSSTMWLLSCFLICIADLRLIDPSLGCLKSAETRAIWRGPKTDVVITFESRH
jgi:hypothetical protein